MDTFLAIASKRDERRYADRPIPEELARRILDAGRLAGNAQNRQPWHFVVVEDRARVERLAETVYEPSNVLTAALVVGIATKGGTRALDVGRAAQNMMLAAWNDGILSCPSGFADRERAREVLALDGEEQPVIGLTFGYPARPRDPERRSAAAWSARANRKPLDELVTYL